MKKTWIISLVLALLLALAACDTSQPQTGVTFYYLKNSNQPENLSVDSFYATENRAYTDETRNLRDCLSLYLRGPVGEDLASPFPDNTRLLEADLQENHLYIHLSQEFSQLTGMDLTAACACLSLTCFDLADVEQVTIISPATEKMPAVEITMSRTNLILTDTVTGETEPQ